MVDVNLGEFRKLLLRISALLPKLANPLAKKPQ
jgi:hypothetical protein